MKDSKDIQSNSKIEEKEEVQNGGIDSNERTDIKVESREVKSLKRKTYCLLCQEYGHIINDNCVINATCFRCGVKGHVRRDCYCLICQEPGHVLTEDCTTCFNCGVKGHVRRNCPDLLDTNSQILVTAEQQALSLQTQSLDKVETKELPNPFCEKKNVDKNGNNLVENISHKPSLFDRPFPQCFLIERKPKFKVYYCSTCKVMCESEEEKRDHFAEKSHIERWQKLGKGFFYCDVCRIRIWHKNNFQQHLRTKRHLKKLKKINPKSKIRTKASADIVELDGKNNRLEVGEDGSSGGRPAKKLKVNGSESS